VKALDTNALVRLLVADDRAQLNRLVKRMDTPRLGGKGLHVASAVWVETIWVLVRNYQLERSDVVAAFRALTSLNHFTPATSVSSRISSAKPKRPRSTCPT
jgi:predicted nucleic-acid-binding protein